jgi:hypothetical protein
MQLRDEKFIKNFNQKAGRLGTDEKLTVQSAVTSSFLGQNNINLHFSLRVKDQFHACAKQQVEVVVLHILTFMSVDGRLKDKIYLTK